MFTFNFFLSLFAETRVASGTKLCWNDIRTVIIS
jgi:hypothetical protein